MHLSGARGGGLRTWPVLLAVCRSRRPLLAYGLVTVWFRILDSNISNQGDRLWDNDMAWNSNGKRFALL